MNKRCRWLQSVHALIDAAFNMANTSDPYGGQLAQKVAIKWWLQLVEELFGVTIERSENSHTWHPDVQFYSLKKEGRQKAYFYLDPYSRPAGAHRGLLQLSLSCQRTECV